MDEIKFGYSTGITDVYLLGEEESLSSFDNPFFDEDSFFVIDSDVPDNFLSDIKDNYNSEVIEVNETKKTIDTIEQLEIARKIVSQDFGILN